MRNELDLSVSVPADDWAYMQRRVYFLESLVIHLSRDGLQIQEWFSAGDLADMRLPGLPASAAGVARRAVTGRWRRRKFGRHVSYHLSSLPARSFDALLARILDIDFAIIEEIAATEPAALTAPPWVLPLMRLMKGEARGDLGAAWRELPAHVPAGVTLPSPDDAALILVELGLSEKMGGWQR